MCEDFHFKFSKFFEVRLVFPTLEDQDLAKVRLYIERDIMNIYY